MRVNVVPTILLIASIDTQDVLRNVQRLELAVSSIDIKAIDKVVQQKVLVGES